MEERTHSFGYWLRRRRKALDLTQEQLAQRVSCSHFTIRKIEADERRPSRHLADRLAKKLEIPAHERERFVAAARAACDPARMALDRDPLVDATDRSGVPEPSSISLVETAQEAFGRGECQRAHELLTEADEGTPLAGTGLVFLADVAYAAGHLDVAIGAWERAYAQNLRAGDALAAATAAVRVGMHLLFDTALLGPVRGWMQRAERLLEGQHETPAQAWLALLHNWERCCRATSKPPGNLRVGRSI